MKDKELDALLPCPFCGGEASQAYSDIYLGVITGCLNDDCDFKPYCRSAQRKSGREAWNKRTTPKAFEKRSLTVAKNGKTVLIHCDDDIESVELFEWLCTLSDLSE